MVRKRRRGRAVDKLKKAEKTLKEVEEKVRDLTSSTATEAMEAMKQVSEAMKDLMKKKEKELSKITEDLMRKEEEIQLAKEIRRLKNKLKEDMFELRIKTHNFSSNTKLVEIVLQEFFRDPSIGMVDRVKRELTNLKKIIDDMVEHLDSRIKYDLYDLERLKEKSEKI